MDLIDSIFANLKLSRIGISELQATSNGMFRFWFRNEDKDKAAGYISYSGLDIASSRVQFFDLRKDFRIYVENDVRDIVVFIAVSGEFRVETSKGGVTYRRGDAFVFSSDSIRSLACMPGARLCAVGFRADDGRRLLERMIGRPLKQPVSIAANFPSQSAVGRALAALIYAAISGLTGKTPVASSSHTAELLQDGMLALLLENLPHNYSDRIVRSRLESLPWAIRKAVDYIIENARENIAVSDVAAAAGLRLRSLQHGFRRFLDSSPEDYVKLVRLREVRRELLDVGSQRSIEDIAREWGFANRGHFATRYRKLYGELPSQTRRSR